MTLSWPFLWKLLLWIAGGLFAAAVIGLIMLWWAMRVEPEYDIAERDPTQEDR